MMPICISCPRKSLDEVSLGYSGRQVEYFSVKLIAETLEFCIELSHGSTSSLQQDRDRTR